MRYHALACDYDDTLATGGALPAATESALRRLRAAGCRLLLVTGRLLEDLERVCPALPMFDAVVAENGAVLSVPARAPAVDVLAAPPPASFVEALIERGVDPLVTGRVIVATWVRHHQVVTEVIRSLGLALHTIPNKRALMILPAGVDKGSGLSAALSVLGVAAEATVAVGDAENDLPLLERAGLAVAVSNALPTVKDVADVVTASPAGAGVAELCERLLTGDLT